jgi:ribose transport system substrate-binding protein
MVAKILNRGFRGVVGKASRLPRALAVTAAAGCLVATSACGGGAASSATDNAPAADVSQYQAIAESAMEPVTAFTGPTTGPAAQPNKKIVFLACGFAGEGCLTSAQAAGGAASALGWDVKTVDGKFDPRVFARTIQEAIDQQVDGIIIDAVDADAVAGPIEKARAAGIVVGSYDSRNEPSETGVSFDVRMSFPQQGEALAAYMIWQHKGDAQPFLLNSPEFKGTAEWTAAAKKVFEDCSSCAMAGTQDFTAGVAATQLPPLAVSVKRQNPGMNVLLVPYDAAVLPIIPSMQQAGILDQVKVGTFNATKPSVALIRKGDLTATVAEPHGWGVWATFDNMNRVFAGEPAVEQNVPIRLITQANVGDIPEGEAWDGDDVDYKAAYQEIWAGK